MTKSILLTRQEPPDTAILSAFQQLQVSCYHIPMIVVEPLPYPTPTITEYDWLFFTSKNAVRFFPVTDLPAAMKIAAIGDQTSAAIKLAGQRVDFSAANATSEVFTAAWLSLGLKEQRILLPNSLKSRHIIKEKLTAAGHQVSELPVYNTVFPAASAVQLQTLLRECSLDYAVFASPSAWNHFFPFMADCPQNNLRIAAIGPITAQTIEASGYAAAILGESELRTVYMQIVKELRTDASI